LAREWKEKHGLKPYFNCPQSPDLSPIENCWFVSKMETQKFGIFDIDGPRTVAVEGWDQLSQKSINH
jgi:hypothetical protein